MHVSLELCEQDLGGKRLGALANLCGTQSSGPSPGGGEGGQSASVRYFLSTAVLRVSNDPLERLNGRKRMIKVRSRGFLNKALSANAIYFHRGGLDFLS